MAAEVGMLNVSTPSASWLSEAPALVLPFGLNGHWNLATWATAPLRIAAVRPFPPKSQQRRIRAAAFRNSLLTLSIHTCRSRFSGRLAGIHWYRSL